MLRCFATKIIGLVGFEPTACRRGDRSTISSRDHLYLVPFCNIARVALLRSEWQSFPCGLEPTALHVSSLIRRPPRSALCPYTTLLRSENSLVHFNRKCGKSINAPLIRNKDYRAGGI